LTVCGSGGIENPADAAQNPPTGFRPRISGFHVCAGRQGSHRKFRHARFPGSVILSGADGDDARHYQEKQVRNAIREATK
jgi:predicted RNA binding protein YcfA (HicA-like mRNA interferase family)